jgi:hypothetical protein
MKVRRVAEPFAVIGAVRREAVSTAHKQVAPGAGLQSHPGA